MVVFPVAPHTNSVAVKFIPAILAGILSPIFGQSKLRAHIN